MNTTQPEATLAEKRRKEPAPRRAAAAPVSGRAAGGTAAAARAGKKRFVTRVFRSGNSDAVRLPRRFGLAGTEMVVCALGGGRLLVTPVAKRAWPEGFFARLGVTADFEAPARPPASPADEARAASLFDD
jgi:virulence-associated protein VagC